MSQASLARHVFARAPSDLSRCCKGATFQSRKALPHSKLSRGFITPAMLCRLFTLSTNKEEQEVARSFAMAAAASCVAASSSTSLQVNLASPAAELKQQQLLVQLPIRPSLKGKKSTLSVSNGSRINMSAGPKWSFEGVATPTALALMAAAVIPEIAEAAQPGISPSLKNLLLSVAAGGVVVVAIGGVVAAVSTFDPVKRK